MRSKPSGDHLTVADRASTVALTALVVTSFVLASCSFGGSGAPGSSDGQVTVVRVVDGDTIVISASGSEERVRLIGINTPESVDPRRPVMCFGKEASNYMTELLPKGSAVRLERDVEARDKYGRLLAYVFRGSDDLFVNLAMVEQGFAEQYSFPPNVAHVETFRDAASKARSEGVGLWSACDKPFKE